MFLQISTLPSNLFKFNGNRWISIDKSITDSYTYNEEYLQYIIDSIDKGLIGLDDLTVGEQEQITEYLKKNA
jgi:methyl coenzyme M reductase subunit D